MDVIKEIERLPSVFPSVTALITFKMLRFLFKLLGLLRGADGKSKTETEHQNRNQFYWSSLCTPDKEFDSGWSLVIVIVRLLQQLTAATWQKHEPIQVLRGYCVCETVCNTQPFPAQL